MVPEKFVASVQYNDWVGTAAADGADANGPATWLEQNGHASPGERLVGVRFFYGENHGNYDNIVYVEFLLLPVGSSESSTNASELSQSVVAVRKLIMSMQLVEFFSLFKRFEIAISLGGIFDTRDVICTD